MFCSQDGRPSPRAMRVSGPKPESSYPAPRANLSHRRLDAERRLSTLNGGFPRRRRRGAVTGVFRIQRFRPDDRPGRLDAWPRAGPRRRGVGQRNAPTPAGVHLRQTGLVADLSGLQVFLPATPMVAWTRTGPLSPPPARTCDPSNAAPVKSSTERTRSPTAWSKPRRPTGARRGAPRTGTGARSRHQHRRRWRCPTSTARPPADLMICRRVIEDRARSCVGRPTEGWPV
jgi:hypothetical protein